MFTRITKTVQIGCVSLRQYPKAAVFTQVKHFSDKPSETTTTDINEAKVEPNEKLGSFAKAFQDFEKVNDKPTEKPVVNIPFKKLLRESKLVDVSSFKLWDSFYYFIQIVGFIQLFYLN